MVYKETLCSASPVCPPNIKSADSPSSSQYETIDDEGGDSICNDYAELKDLTEREQEATIERARKKEDNERSVGEYNKVAVGREREDADSLEREHEEAAVRRVRERQQEEAVRREEREDKGTVIRLREPIYVELESSTCGEDGVWSHRTYLEQQHDRLS